VARAPGAADDRRAQRSLAPGHPAARRRVRRCAPHPYRRPTRSSTPSDRRSRGDSARCCGSRRGRIRA
jgi:hypothetical protein